MMAIVPLVSTAYDLKFRLLSDGIVVSSEAETAWHQRFDGPLTLAEYATTSGVALVLPGAQYVNAPLTSDRGPNVASLEFTGQGFSVALGDTHVEVDVVPVPGFHNRSLEDRHTGDVHPLTRFGVTHTDRVRVSPIEGCAWKCHFCDLPYEFTYRKKHAEDLLLVIAAAVDDPQAPARHVLVSGGTPRKPIPARAGRPAQDDERWIDDVFATLAERSPIPVDVMMPPRRNLGHPAWLRSVGVNSVSINLEVSDPERARIVAPVKSQLGRDHALEYIARAVNAFGVGFVQSLMVFGSAIEPLESTLEGVRDLVQRGCIPTLSAFRPHRLTPLADAPAATYEEMVEVFERTLEICADLDTGVLPGPRCVACQHNAVAVPTESPFYVDLDGDLTARGWQTS